MKWHSHLRKYPGLMGLPFSSGLVCPVEPCWVDNALHNRQSSLWVDSVTSSASFQLGLEVKSGNKILPFLTLKVIFWIGIVLYSQPPSQIRKFVFPSRLVFELLFFFFQLLFKGGGRQYVLTLTLMLIGTVGTQVVGTSPHDSIPVELEVLRVTLLVHFPVFQKAEWLILLDNNFIDRVLRLASVSSWRGKRHSSCFRGDPLYLYSTHWKDQPSLFTPLLLIDHSLSQLFKVTN